MRDKPNEWVSIADLMAGVVGVVILFFIILALAQHKTQSAAASEGEAAREARTEIIIELASKLDRTPDGQEIEVFKGYDVVGLPSDGMFARGSSQLSPHGRETTEALLKALSEILPCYSAGSDAVCTDTKPMRQPCNSGARCTRARPIFEAVLIEGHADSTTSRGDCDNWCLSTARAKAVFDFARSNFRDLVRLTNSDDQPLFGLAGYGDTRPIRLGNYAVTDPRQRRVEIRFVLSPSPSRDVPPGSQAKGPPSRAQ